MNRLFLLGLILLSLLSQGCDLSKFNSRDSENLDIIKSELKSLAYEDAEEISIDDVKKSVKFVDLVLEEISVSDPRIEKIRRIQNLWKQAIAKDVEAEASSRLAKALLDAGAPKESFRLSEESLKALNEAVEFVQRAKEETNSL